MNGLQKVGSIEQPSWQRETEVQDRAQMPKRSCVCPQCELRGMGAMPEAAGDIVYHEEKENCNL